MQVQADDAIKAITEGNRQKAVDILKKENIAYKEITVPNNGHAGRRDCRYEQAQTRFATNCSPTSAPTTGMPRQALIRRPYFSAQNIVGGRIRREATEQAKTIIDQRIDAFGVAEPTVQFHGREEDHQILVQMPGVDNPDRVKELDQRRGEARVQGRGPPGRSIRRKKRQRRRSEGTVPGR